MWTFLEIFICGVKGEFLATRHTTSLKKGLLNTLRICVNANVCMFERSHERANRRCVLHSSNGLPGQRC